MLTDSIKLKIFDIARRTSCGEKVFIKMEGTRISTGACLYITYGYVSTVDFKLGQFLFSPNEKFVMKQGMLIKESHFHEFFDKSDVICTITYIKNFTNIDYRNILSYGAHSNLTPSLYCILDNYLLSIKSKKTDEK